jgi:hypothetical protein
MKVLTVQLPPFFSRLIPLRSKYSSQNLVPKHPQSNYYYYTILYYYLKTTNKQNTLLWFWSLKLWNAVSAGVTQTQECNGSDLVITQIVCADVLAKSSYLASWTTNPGRETERNKCTVVHLSSRSSHTEDAFRNKMLV